MNHTTDRHVAAAAQAALPWGRMPRLALTRILCEGERRPDVPVGSGIRRSWHAQIRDLHIRRAGQAGPEVRS